MRETPLAVLVVACFVAAACGEPLTAAPDGWLSSTDGRAIDVGADGSQTGILVDYPAPTHCDHGLVLDPSRPEIAMAGGSPRHARLAMRVGRLLGNQLERSPCEPHSSDLKIHIGRAKRTTYADVVIVCGEPRASSEDDDNATTNPSLRLLTRQRVVLRSTREKQLRVGESFTGCRGP